MYSVWCSAAAKVVWNLFNVQTGSLELLLKKTEPSQPWTQQMDGMYMTYMCTSKGFEYLLYGHEIFQLFFFLLICETFINAGSSRGPECSLMRNLFIFKRSWIFSAPIVPEKCFIVFTMTQGTEIIGKILKQTDAQTTIIQGISCL